MGNKKIDFYVNLDNLDNVDNISNKIEIPLTLTYLLVNQDKLKKIISQECHRHIPIDVHIIEKHIILYDEEHNVMIDSVQDLVENKTKKCKILLNKIVFIFNNTHKILEIEKNSLYLEPNLKYKIINECYRQLNLDIFEDNIVLYDIKNDTKIEKTEDLIKYQTKICKIVIIPIHY